DTKAMAVLLLKAADQIADRAREKDAGVNATIIRPLHAADLVAHVRAHLGATLAPEPTVEELLRDRADIAGSLAALATGDAPEDAAGALCGELLRGGVEGVAVLTFPGDGTALTMAVAGSVPSPFQAGRPLPVALGVRLEERA